MTTVEELAALPVEDMTASALAVHYAELAGVADGLAAHCRRLSEVAAGTDPTTYTDRRLLVSSAELLSALGGLRDALGDQLVAAGHIARGGRA